VVGVRPPAVPLAQQRVEAVVEAGVEAQVSGGAGAARRAVACLSRRRGGEQTPVLVVVVVVVDGGGPAAVALLQGGLVPVQAAGAAVARPLGR